MALTNVGLIGNVSYIAESTDIVDNKISGASSPGKIVYILDTGKKYIIEPDQTLTEMSEGMVVISPETKFILGKNDLGNDAWGRQKVVFDYSLFHGIWTYDVPNRIWKQKNKTGATWVEQASVDNSLVKSSQGMLHVTGTDGTDVLLESKRNPRYQPNRGHLYSTAMSFPNPEITGTRSFGIGTVENRVFLSVEGDGESPSFYFTYRSTIGGETADYPVDITSNLPDGFDFSKGHVYDIQMEWRGVGNMYVYVDLDLVYTYQILGTLSGVSVANPALPVFFESSGATADGDVVIRVGCVDVTSEGGTGESLLPITASTGSSLLSTSGGDIVALLAVRSPTTITYEGETVIYTRDAIIDAITSFCKDEAFRIYHHGRAVSAVTVNALSGWQQANDSFLEYRTDADTLLDPAFQTDLAAGKFVELYDNRGEVDLSIREDISVRERSKYYVTPGDIYIFSIKSDTNSSAGLTVELSEEI